MLLQCLTQLCRQQVNIPFTCFLLPADCNAAIIIIIDKYSCRTLWGERVGRESLLRLLGAREGGYTPPVEEKERKKKINLHVLLVSFPFHSLNVCDIYIIPVNDTLERPRDCPLSCSMEGSTNIHNKISLMFISFFSYVGCSYKTVTFINTQFKKLVA